MREQEQPLLRRLLQARERGLQRLQFIGLLQAQKWTLLRRRERRLLRVQERGMAMGEDSHQ